MDASQAADNVEVLVQMQVTTRRIACASPSIEMMMSEPRQWTVCGALRFVFALISEPSITLWSFGARWSAVSTMWMFV